MAVSDVRALSDQTLNLFLYPIAGWGIALALLFVVGQLPVALGLLTFLSLWQLGLVAVWGTRLLRRFAEEEVSEDEAKAGVSSVGHILAASAMNPAVVFVAADPLAPSSLSTAIGCAVVSGAAYLAVNLGVRVGNRLSLAGGLALAGLALPMNTTGAVTVASVTGVLSAIVDVAPDMPGDGRRRLPRERNP